VQPQSGKPSAAWLSRPSQEGDEDAIFDGIEGDKNG
jgi:hypothetical protein